MKLHLTLAAFVLALAAVSTSAWSEVTNGQAPDPATGSAATSAAGNWSAALEKLPSDNSTADLSKDLSAEARILNENLANFDKPGPIPNTQKPAGKTAAMPGAAASGAKAPADVPDDWGSEWANKIRDFFRPIHKQVVSSEVLQAVREMDIALPKKRESDDAASVPAIAPATTPLIPVPVGPLTTEEQRHRDQLTSSIAMEQLINDVKPYAYGLLALLVLGYLGVVMWRFLRWKQDTSGKRIHRSGVARKGRSRTPTSREVPSSSRAAPLASRASPSQSESKNERLSP